MDPNNPNSSFGPNSSVSSVDPNTVTPTPVSPPVPFSPNTSTAPQSPPVFTPGATFPDLSGTNSSSAAPVADTSFGSLPPSPASPSVNNWEQPTVPGPTSNWSPPVPATGLPDVPAGSVTAPASAPPPWDTVNTAAPQSSTSVDMAAAPFSVPAGSLDVSNLPITPNTPISTGNAIPSPEPGSTASVPDSQAGFSPWASNNQGTGLLSTPEPAVSPETLSSAEPLSAPDLAPTDLSHLVGMPITPEAPTTPVAAPAAQPDTLVVAPQAVVTNAQPVVAGSGSGGFPKWILLVGVLVILLVAAGSAYFILGIGRPEEATTSVPAVQQPLTNPPKTILPTTPPASSNSDMPGGGFGELTGSGSAALETTISPTKPASTSGSSAIELLRQRTQVSPTPVR